MTSVFELCHPREDVIHGRLRDEEFAADLAGAFSPTSMVKEYSEPAIFFQNTYPTRGLRTLLETVCRRLSGTGGEMNSIIRLDTQYGGGKTHSLIALIHAVRGMKGVTNVSEFVDPVLLPKGRTRVAALDGENADPANGLTLEEGLLAHSLWGEMAYRLAGREGFGRIRKSDETHTAPGDQTIAELFGGEPTLVVIDEVSVYLRKVARIFPNAAEQFSAFIQSLIKAVSSTPRAALVFTLAVRADDKEAKDAYNVMYAELADFFYVWLKRTAGLLFPEQFVDHLTDKDREAVANPAKFKDFSKVKGSGGAKKRAARDYQERMQAIFAEARRVLKPDGIMTLMFTHKATGAWDALAKGLVDAGFVITASWPIQTEAEGSLHIKDKNAAKSTIFLVCRPRQTPAADAEARYWEDVEPKVTNIVLQRVWEFQAMGMRGVDLYLSCFGPALEEFSKHWPMKRGRANQRPLPPRGAQLKLMEDEDWDPYAVRPEDALMAARSAVKQWRLQQLTTVRRQAHLDPVTEWFVLAWDAFHSPQFPADEALKLARVVGVNFDEQLRNKVLELKGGDVVVWDSSQRAKKSAIGSIAGTCRLDALHHAAQAVRQRNVGIAKDIIERAELKKDSAFLLAMEAILNVLPTPRMVSGKGVLAGAAADAEALEKLRKLMFADQVPQAKEWVLFEQPENAGK
jgi:hypothetical protein